MTQEALKRALINAEIIVSSNLADDCLSCESTRGSEQTMIWVTEKGKRIVDLLKEALAQPEQEPIYQYQLANGSWIDQTKESHDYNVRHGQATVRVVYTRPPQPEQEPVVRVICKSEGSAGPPQKFQEYKELNT